MRSLMVSGVLALALAASGAAAQGRSYGGEEVEALRCAYLFGSTSNTMHDAGYISDEEMDAMITWSGLILMRYVTGTLEEKLRAMDVIAGRRSVLGSLREFGEVADSCASRFPVS